MKIKTLEILKTCQKKKDGSVIIHHQSQQRRRGSEEKFKRKIKVFTLPEESFGVEHGSTRTGSTMQSKE